MIKSNEWLECIPILNGNLKHFSEERDSSETEGFAIERLKSECTKS